MKRKMAGSFAEGGHQLRLSRSAFSKHVAELVRNFGVQLLNRTTRRALPNENGQMSFERALAVLSSAGLARTRFAALRLPADGDHWIQWTWSLCVNNAEMLRDAAIRGCGVALIPTFLAGEALDKGTLRAVL